MSKIKIFLCLALFNSNTVWAATKMVNNRRDLRPSPIVELATQQAPVNAEKGLLANIRQALSIPPVWSIAMTTPTASPLQPFLQANLIFQTGAIQRTQPILLSQDQRYYIIGTLYDANLNYDAWRMSQITTAGAASKGNLDAPITVVEYTDPQCLACKKMKDNFDMEKILQDYGKKVRWISKNVPVSTEHKWALQASAACLCAEAQKKGSFWPMQKFFFDHQREITPDTITTQSLDAAKSLGLNLEQFQQCWQTQKVVEQIQADGQESENIGVAVTPTFVVNGRLLAGNLKEEDLRAMIDLFLQQKVK